jgi:glycogen phosphorylase
MAKRKTTTRKKKTGPKGNSGKSGEARPEPQRIPASLQGMSSEDFKQSIADHIKFSRAKSRHTATDYDRFYATALAVRDRLVERWMKTQDVYYERDVKRVYYFSMEFLIGRTLGNALINLEAYDACHHALHGLGVDLEEVREEEFDAGLGNGGLGRLGACFLDSMATLGIPGYGCGIRYEYGMFNQRIIDGQQREEPDPWLRLGNPWELPRGEYTFPVGFYGHTERETGKDDRTRFRWVPGETVLAMAYDTPVPGYGNRTCNTLRLYAAQSPKEFDLQYFNDGNYIRAADAQVRSENISKVLYPSDANIIGKELRLKQQYFLAAAALHDILRRYLKHHDSLDALPDKVAIQLNETHLAIAIPELMRVLIDEFDYEWDPAWDIVTRVFSYTNHTILPEALEVWPSKLVERLLPRHQEIIFEINHRLLREVQLKYPGDHDRMRRMSIVQEGRERKIRMAFLGIIGSHSVNGVAALHTDILKQRVFADFHELWPEKINNKTNGVTPRRWVRKANRALSTLITGHIGSAWTRDLERLRKLEPLADDPDFRRHFREVKAANKRRMAETVLADTGVEIDPASIFDVQVKRIHEYKRQLMNILHVVTTYNRLKAGNREDFVPRTVMIGGKSAPAYTTAKLIIRLACAVASTINRDKDTSDLLKMIFLPNYRVSLAEIVIPAADISEQISTAGYEASGTGNMKLSLNGALTVGTLDGANIEIREAVGAENFFLFGLTADEVVELKRTGYRPGDYYDQNPELKLAVDMISSGHFYPDEPGAFRPLMDELLGRDNFMLMADFAAYCECQERAAQAYRDEENWSRLAILNVARMGHFSSDRTIRQYAEEIWNVEAVEV